MSEVSNANLGGVLTALGIDGKFLENGELKTFPLVERGQIVDSIVSEKLARGQWSRVVEMIYGGLGNAGALFDGDRDELKKNIVESASRDKKSKDIDCSIEKILVDSGEVNLLLDLAVNLDSMNYENFHGLHRYFSQAERIGEFDKIVGRKAVEEGRYSIALAYFKRASGNDGITELFDLLIENPFSGRKSFISDGKSVLEEIASYDPELKEERLALIVRNGLDGRGVSPATALKLSKDHDITLEGREESRLYDLIVGSIGACDVTRSRDPRLRLLWAKRFASESPKEAYDIFVNHGYEGGELKSALLSGLIAKKERYSYETRLDVSKVKPDHLRLVYEQVPLEVKVRIARVLEDKAKLKDLSEKFLEKRDHDKAYRLLVEGEGDLESDDANSLRGQLIDEGINGNYVSIHIGRGDKAGMRQAYDVLMRKRGKKRQDCLEEAYKFALRMENESLVQRARKAMVKVDSVWALGKFRGDSVGVDYVVGLVSKEQGVDLDTVKPFAEKYL